VERGGGTENTAQIICIPRGASAPAADPCPLARGVRTRDNVAEGKGAAPLAAGAETGADGAGGILWLATRVSGIVDGAVDGAARVVSVRIAG
jgi:hypothetical protein